MKRLNVQDRSGIRITLFFFPEHDSALGHFADLWEVHSWRFSDGKRVGRRYFKSFVPAANYFNKLVAKYGEAGK